MKRAVSVLAFAALIAVGATTARAQEPSSLREDVEGRDTWFWSLRSFPSTERPYDKMSRLHQNLLDYLHRTAALVTASSAPLGGAWRSIGPNGVWVFQLE